MLLAVLVPVNVVTAGLFSYCADAGDPIMNCDSSCSGSCATYSLSGPCGMCAPTFNPFSWCSAGPAFTVTSTKTPGSCRGTSSEGLCQCTATGPSDPPASAYCNCTP